MIASTAGTKEATDNILHVHSRQEEEVVEEEAHHVSFRCQSNTGREVQETLPPKEGIDIVVKTLA